MLLVSLHGIWIPFSILNNPYCLSRTVQLENINTKARKTKNSLNLNQGNIFESM